MTWVSGLWRNVLAGTRLALFLPVRSHHFHASPVDFALLSLVSFCFWVASAAARNGFEGEFDALAFPGYAADIVLVLAAALLIAAAFGPAVRLLLVAVALTALQPFFHLVALGLILSGIPALYAQIVFVGFLFWVWIASLRAVAATAGTQRPQFLQAALVVSAMIAIDFSLLPEIEPWKAAEEEEQAPALAEERVFHLQGELIERALAAIRPGRSGAPELYFVGFAPDARQDVFVREMRFVRRLFDQRFGAAGHSIALANSHDALEEFPIASTTNLARALRRVGEVMDPAEDFLFLFLSAHGDEQHRLSASQPPLELAALTPTALARMLQDSGIKWRVIVVSACFSGGYIEPLRDANTIVITAAAPDRSSFGCTTGRDFTYFGQAFFRDALGKTRSFSAAFEAAREIVSRQETAEGLRPSLPQMWVGAEIGARLATLKDFSDQPDKQ